jgi:hypothetical protein
LAHKGEESSGSGPPRHFGMVSALKRRRLAENPQERLKKEIHRPTDLLAHADSSAHSHNKDEQQRPLPQLWLQWSWVGLTYELAW